MAAASVVVASDRYKADVFRKFFDDALACGGAFAAVDRQTGKIIGSSRFDYFDEQNDEIEIGWTFLARAYWGGVYNGEMKRLMLDHAFRYVDRVTFRVGQDNVISRGAMENIGGRLTDRIDMTEGPNGPVPHVVYEITRNDFASGPLA